MNLKSLLFLPLLFSSSVGAQEHEIIHLNSDNTILFKAVVDPTSVTEVALKAVELVAKRGSKDYPLYLVLDCPGGGIYEGESFIQFMKMIPNLNTVTIFGASMCAGIAEALPGKRFVTENGILMFHRAKGSFDGQFETGEIESRLAFWKSFVRKMEKRSADRIGISLEKYKENVKDEWWIVGQDNVDQKTADGVVDLICSQELVEQKIVVTTQDMFGEGKAEISACPLFR